MRLKTLSIDVEKVRTNIVYMDLNHDVCSANVVQKLECQGVRLLAAGPHRLRAVTHYQITRDLVDQAVAGIARVCA